MLFTPDERRALLALGGLLAIGLAVRLIVPGPPPPEGGGDSLLVVLAEKGADRGLPDPAAPPPGIAEEGLLRINEAAAGDLTRLPRVGPRLAQRILDSRNRDGPFRSLRDLTRVPGIGPKTAAVLAPRISFEVRRAAADCTMHVQSATTRSVPR